jgi:hypothetical protein
MYQKITQNSPLILTMGTSLPTNPTDGQMFIFTDSLPAPTYQWQLRYIAAATRWIFIGGTPLFGYVAAANLTTSTAYVALTGDPSVTFPLTGHYLVTLSAQISDAAGGANTGFMSCTLGAAGPDDLRALITDFSAGGFASASRTFRTAAFVAELTAGSTAVARYRNLAATNTRYRERLIQIVPEYVK